MKINKNLIKSMANQPLMILPSAVDALLGADLELSNITQKKPELKILHRLQSQDKSNNTEQTAIAVISIHGALQHRSGLFTWLFGGGTYEQIRQLFFQAINDVAVDAIVLDLDSPGGMVTGVFDLVDDIYNARGVKPIYAILNERAYSAAYAIASAADTIYLPRTAGCGSIGVLSVHFEASKWEETTGVAYTAVFAGERKNDFSTHEPLSKEARALLQAEVDKVYELFVSTVARNRDIDPEVIKKTKAGFFTGQGAVEVGLADKVMAAGQAMKDIFKKLESKKGGNVMKFNEQLKQLIADNGDEAVAALDGLGFIPAENAITAQNVDAAREEGIVAGMERSTEIINLCTLADQQGMAAGLIEKRMSAEDAREKVMAAKAKETDESNINSTVSATTVGGINPLMADAKKRAGIA